MVVARIYEMLKVLSPLYASEIHGAPFEMQPKPQHCMQAYRWHRYRKAKWSGWCVFEIAESTACQAGSTPDALPVHSMCCVLTFCYQSARCRVIRYFLVRTRIAECFEQQQTIACEVIWVMSEFIQVLLVNTPRPHLEIWATGDRSNLGSSVAVTRVSREQLVECITHGE
jgi:hypothetical protein